MRTLAALAALAFAAPAAADQVAYVWADNPTAASYDASAGYAKRPEGGAVRITRTGTGAYQVALGTIVQAAGANIQTTAYGGEANICNVVNWGGGAVNVRCFDAAGRPADTRFSLLAVRGEDAAAPKIGYLWAHDAAGATYTPSQSYMWPTQLNASIQRAGDGVYLVRAGSVTKSDGIVPLITAYGDRPVRCEFGGWRDDAMVVKCFGPQREAVNNRFSMLLQGAAENQADVAFAWANHPRVDWSLPALAKQHNSGPVITSKRTAQGVYQVEFGAIVRQGGGNLQVVSQDANGGFCTAASWSGDHANVRCFANDGRAMDASFVAVFRR